MPPEEITVLPALVACALYPIEIALEPPCSPAWGVLDYSSLTGKLTTATGISIVNGAITNTLPNVNGDFTQATSSNSAFILNKPIITTSSSVTSVGVVC